MDERRATLAAFDADGFQFLLNCQLLTEGWDSPGVACVAIARPTKSRSLYTQMIGRGLRTAPGKSDCLVIDFTDASRRLDLIGPEDVLGAELGDQVVKEAKRERAETDKEPERVLDHLRKATATVKYKTTRERMVAERRAAAKDGRGRKLVSAEVAWPLFGLDPLEIERSARWGLKQATEAQISRLLKMGVDPGDASGDVVLRMIEVMKERQALGLATPAQLRLLSKYGRAHPSMSVNQAREAIDRIAKRGWKR